MIAVARVDRARRGERDDRFALEMTAITPVLRAYARSLVRDVELSLDLTQETLLRAWKHRDRYRDGSNMKAWMFQILRNLFLSHVRRARIVSFQALPEGMPEGTVAAAQEHAVLLRELGSGWERLNAGEQVAMMYIAIEGRSYDAAALSAVPLGTTKSRIARARATLRLHLDGELAPLTPDAAARGSEVADDGATVSATEREAETGAESGVGTSRADTLQIAMLRAYRSKRVMNVKDEPDAQ